MLGFIGGIMLAIGFSATALGYAGQVVAVLTISGPTGPLTCGSPVTLQATALDLNGEPIGGQRVHWALKSTPSHQDTIKPRSSITDENGVATTTITFACVVGERTVTARADKVRASAVLNISAGGVVSFTSQVRGVISLPNTSTVAEAPANGVPIAGILGMLAALAGSGLILRRFMLGRRQ
jgi:hypothetical protein